MIHDIHDTYIYIGVYNKLCIGKLKTVLVSWKRAITDG